MSEEGRHVHVAPDGTIYEHVHHDHEHVHSHDEGHTHDHDHDECCHSHGHGHTHTHTNTKAVLNRLSRGDWTSGIYPSHGGRRKRLQ